MAKSPLPISDNVIPPRAKAISNYQNSRYVSTESRVNGYDYGIILNQQGKVAVTPPFSAGILESITRETVKRLLEKRLETPVVERDVERRGSTISDCTETYPQATLRELEAEARHLPQLTFA